MSGKEFWINMIRPFSMLVTLITACTFILGSIFDPDAQFGYEAFASPLIVSACCLLPGFVMYSKKELSVKEFIIRKIIHFILIEAIVLFFLPYAVDKSIGAKIGEALAVLVVYVIVHLVIFIQDYKFAKRATEDLKKFQDRVEDE